jgi:hypothetical protein
VSQPVEVDRAFARRRVVRGTLLAVGVLYAWACLTPAINDGGPPSSDLDFLSGPHIGLEILLFGWQGGNNGVPWSANVVLGLGLLALAGGRFRLACTLGGVATALGLTTWWVWGYRSLSVGYFLWQGSLVALAVGAGVGLTDRFANRSLSAPARSPASS